MSSRSSINFARNFKKIPPPGLLAHRLLAGVCCFAGIIAGILFLHIRGALARPDHKLYYGHDLLPSYVAGSLIRHGRTNELYDLTGMRAEEAKVIGDADIALDHPGGPWLNPPFFALAFVPLAKLPYREASLLFLGINLLLLALVFLCFIRWLGVRDWRRLLVPMALCTTMPFWQAMGHQQNSFISLALLTLATSAWLAGRPAMAGVLSGLLFFKPQLALAVSAVLIVIAGRRALLGVAASILGLLAINVLLLPGTLSQFLTRLSPIVQQLQSEPIYNWARQDTFQSFWRLLLLGHVAGPTPLAIRLDALACSAVFACLLGWQMLRYLCCDNPKLHAELARRLFSLSILFMPLLMPYYMDYDLLLLSVPATLFASYWLHQPPGTLTRADRWQLGLWITLFVITQISPGLAGQSRFNLAVPVLAMLAVSGFIRCNAIDIWASDEDEDLSGIQLPAGGKLAA